MKKLILLFAVFISSGAYAGGWTNWAKPIQIDLERGHGMMVYGAFGNPGQCTTTDRIYIQSSHPDYDRLYSMILAAYMSGKRIAAYSHTCDSVGWYSVDTTTYNYITPSGVVNIKD